MTTATAELTRDEAVTITKRELRRRSGKTWSVRGGRGTSWGIVTVTAPPARCDAYGGMSDEDRTELAALLGLDTVHHQGHMACQSWHESSGYRGHTLTDLVARARGEKVDEA